MNNIFDFTPYVGIGEILFGCSREKLRNLLGDYKEFRKSKFSQNTADDFKILHAFYDVENRLEAVEFFPEAGIIFNGKNLFDFSYMDLKLFLNDGAAKEDAYSFTSLKYGISFSQRDDGKIESILVVKAGYWD